MSATLVSSNTTIKVNAAVSATNTANNNTVTVYTAPAGGYAIVQVFCSQMSATSAVATVGGRTFMNLSVNSNLQGIYVGPSQSLQIVGTGFGNVTLLASGCEFINTP